jgi:hypothetical protein
LQRRRCLGLPLSDSVTQPKLPQSRVKATSSFPGQGDEVRTCSKEKQKKKKRKKGKKKKGKKKKQSLQDEIYGLSETSHTSRLAR